MPKAKMSKAEKKKAQEAQERLLSWTGFDDKLKAEQARPQVYCRAGVVPAGVPTMAKPPDALDGL